MVHASSTPRLDELFRWAWDSENIRAILLTGSRADPSRSIDDLSDYDLTVFVEDLGPITGNTSLAEQFGSVMVRWPRRPEPTFDPDWITQLALYEDGTRIDFQFTTSSTREVERPGPYFCVLVDKDRLSEELSSHPVEGSSIPPPTAEDFADRVNAFWWDIPYVAKALKRGELDYAVFSMDCDVRFAKLHPLIRWYIGMSHGPDTDVGINGRWFRRYLEPDVWDAYVRTFSGVDPSDKWRALFASTGFVRTVGNELARHYGFDYPKAVDHKVTRYLQAIKNSAA
jgi:aminoglycoside 6-adenylyltransferase